MYSRLLSSVLRMKIESSRPGLMALISAINCWKTPSRSKSTPYRTIQSGDILYKGKSIVSIPAHERVREGIVQVPEGRRLFPSMTVMDNLLIGSYLPKARAERAQTLEMVLDIFPKMADRRTQLAGSLSGGEQQMCAIGRALMAKPELLMLDEPSLGLAPVIVDTVFASLEKICAMGVTILLVEQNLLASLDIADRGYVIEVGSNVIDDTAEGLANNNDVKAAYLGI